MTCHTQLLENVTFEICHLRSEYKVNVCNGLPSQGLPLQKSHLGLRLGVQHDFCEMADYICLCEDFGCMLMMTCGLVAGCCWQEERSEECSVEEEEHEEQELGSAQGDQ